jgi:DNA-binding Xre family transcriptional regulator
MRSGVFVGEAYMIISYFDELRARKGRIERRKITLQVVAKEAGLSYTAVQRISSDRMTRIDMNTLNALCRYFDVKTVAEIIEYLPDEDDTADS